MTRKVSLHVRVLGIGVFVLMILFGSAIYYYRRLEEESLEERMNRTARYVWRVVGLMIEQAEITGDTNGLKEGLAKLLQSDDELASLRLHAGGRVHRDFYLTGTPAALSPLRYFEIKQPLRDMNDRELGTLAIGFWQRSVLEESSGVSILNAIIIGDLMVMFGLFLHLMLRELVTRPLEKFVEATRRIASGDLSAPIPVAGQTLEEERLASSFADMIERLRVSREEISRANAELEQRVATRTEELRQAKNASDTVVATIADGIYTVDADRNIRIFNSAAEKLTGLKSADVVGKKCYDVLRYPFCKDNCILMRLHEKHGPAERPGEEYLEEKRSGGRAWLVSGALFASTEFTGGAETIKDLSYSRKMQQQMRQVDKLTSLGILSAGVAHEINNPLSNIRIYGQLLQEDLGRMTAADQGPRDALRHILEQTDRASSIVRKMLEFSRQSQPEMESIDIADVLHQSLEMVRYMLDAKRIGVKLELAPDLPRVAGSRTSLQQVFVNLFTNAGQAMTAGGALAVEARAAADPARVTITVHDTGCGIKEGDLERIFDPFFTTKDVGEGTGLGLSISYGIIKDHRGDLSVESSEGEGTTFTIALPVLRAVEAVN